MSARNHDSHHGDHHDHGHHHHDHGQHHDAAKDVAFPVSLISQSALMRCAYVVTMLVPLWIAVLWVIRS